LSISPRVPANSRFKSPHTEGIGGRSPGPRPGPDCQGSRGPSYSARKTGGARPFCSAGGVWGLAPNTESQKRQNTATAEAVPRHGFRPRKG
jgi:hypothetical protein